MRDDFTARLNDTTRKYLLARAADIKSAGNTVGANNMELSNLLWRAEAELRNWIKEKFD